MVPLANGRLNPMVVQQWPFPHLWWTVKRVTLRGAELRVDQQGQIGEAEGGIE